MTKFIPLAFQHPKLCPADPEKLILIGFFKPDSPNLAATYPEIKAPTDLSVFEIL